jgi:hypothetical protein
VPRPELLEPLVGGEARTDGRQLEYVAVRVPQVDRLGVGTVEHLGARDPARGEVLAPGLEIVLAFDREGKMVGGPSAHPSILEPRVLEAGHERSWPPHPVAEEQVASARIVAVDRLLDESHPEHVAVEGRRTVDVPAD